MDDQSSSTTTSGPESQPLHPSTSSTSTKKKTSKKSSKPGLFSRLFRHSSKKPSMDLVVSAPSDGRLSSEPKPQRTSQTNIPHVPKTQAAFFQDPGWTEHFFVWVEANGHDREITPTLVQMYRNAQQLTTSGLTFDVASDFINDIFLPALRRDECLDEMLYLTIEGNPVDYELDDLEQGVSDLTSFNAKDGGYEMVSQLPQNLAYHVLAFFSGYKPWLESSEGQQSARLFWESKV